jgi:hypothetical protein
LHICINAIAITVIRVAISSKLTFATTTLNYWHIGKRINSDILENQRADYGQQIVVAVSRQLTAQYGRSFEEKSLRRMMQIARIFNDEQIAAKLWRQLSWNHFITLIPVKVNNLIW